MISAFLNLQRLVLWPIMWSSLKQFHVHLRRMCIPLGGMFCKFLLGPFGVTYGSRLMFPDWFLSGWSIHYWKGGSWGLLLLYCFSVSPFRSVSICLIYFRWFIIGYLCIYDCYILLIDHYIMTFFVSFYHVWCKVYFIWYNYWYL